MGKDSPARTTSFRAVLGRSLPRALGLQIKNPLYGLRQVSPDEVARPLDRPVEWFDRVMLANCP